MLLAYNNSEEYWSGLDYIAGNDGAVVAPAAGTPVERT